ncbi:protein of unknown function [Octadecabacter temperatus]|uniref:Uncharacterized protein n=1 Tax=Octadecabacter temperatus TaxID=1458307 RepID=A0A0K0Y5S7_9RHOB|nr:DUF4329 domain-containing protein [Octadecabacter temperatus]AKS46236.1 hypothetical protein OSB_16880 [Octadecabacter temperatus]SIO10253.1 protein of unknown function [Octadecabacter temperatus]
MMKLTALMTAATFALTACGVPQSQVSPKGEVSQPRLYNTGFTVAPSNAPSGPVVDNFARGFLDSIQAQSIAERREYCGYIFIDGTGRLQGTPPRPGSFAGCDMPIPRAGQGIIASYHTHGAFGRAYDNEVPSVIDLASDFQFGIDGYVSTPGGRVWLVDFQTQSTQQLCGLRCVTSDPGFVPQGEAGIRQSYSIETLQRRFAGF